MMSICTHKGRATFTKASCNITGQNVKGLCGKYGLITFSYRQVSKEWTENLGRALLE